LRNAESDRRRRTTRPVATIGVDCATHCMHIGWTVPRLADQVPSGRDRPVGWLPTVHRWFIGASLGGGPDERRNSYRRRDGETEGGAAGGCGGGDGVGGGRARRREAHGRTRRGFPDSTTSWCSCSRTRTSIPAGV
jgi:hypothetical protein